MQDSKALLTDGAALVICARHAWPLNAKESHTNRLGLKKEDVLNATEEKPLEVLYSIGLNALLV